MRTNAGRDFQARVMGDPGSNGSGSYAPACYLALSNSGTAPAATDTTLAGEISGGTLGRAQASYAHVNGTATYTLSKSFTADQNVTLRKVGVFNASSGGTMVFEGAMSSEAVVQAGDQIQITVTVTM